MEMLGCENMKIARLEAVLTVNEKIKEITCIIETDNGFRSASLVLDNPSKFTLVVPNE
jgi:hypothetical protein